MTWRKLSDCQWAAASGLSAFLICKDPDGFYWADMMKRNSCGSLNRRPMGVHQSLAKAKRRCEAERIMG